jgi:hypothetical protein
LGGGTRETIALATLLTKKDIITEQEFLQQISEGKAIYRRLLNPTGH